LPFVAAVLNWLVLSNLLRGGDHHPRRPTNGSSVVRQAGTVMENAAGGGMAWLGAEHAAR
jgi:hypothetical protein